jgi:hypothetical protein
MHALYMGHSRRDILPWSKNHICTHRAGSHSFFPIVWSSYTWVAVRETSESGHGPCISCRVALHIHTTMLEEPYIHYTHQLPQIMMVHWIIDPNHDDPSRQIHRRAHRPSAGLVPCTLWYFDICYKYLLNSIYEVVHSNDKISRETWTMYFIDD